MRVAFKVDRIGFYRLFAPLVDECLRAGDEVILLHRDYPGDRTGLKAYQWADPAAVPAFRAGEPRVRQWRTEAELHDLAREGGADALVTIWSWADVPPCERLRDEGVAWVALQESHEFHIFPAEMLLRPDITCMFSGWWIELAERYYAEPRLRSRLVATGWPELDSYALVDRAAVRRRLGIAEGAPVIALASYKQHADDPWEQLVFRSSGTLSASVRALLGGRPGFLRSAWLGVTYAGLLRALKSFCVRNGAVLVSKSRGKDRPPKMERELADRSLTDEGFYPATVVELSAISDIFVSFLSTVTLEAVYGGAASICPMPPDESEWLRAPASLRFRELLGYREPGTIWNYPGAVHQRPIAELIDALPHASLADFPLDRGARARYIRTFLNEDGPGHAERTRRAILSTVAQKATRPAG